ncbi:MAG: hypothetical protein MUC94_07110 [bacterium]|nr:hypothetical protein [bacterium]
MKFYKSAKVLILRPDILSITLGMLWALFVVIITIISVASKQTIGLVELFKVIYPFYRSSFWSILPGFVFGFINGYILGFLISYIYCWLVRKRVCDCGDLIFEIDFDKKANEIFPLKPAPTQNPFTIAIVANPEILKEDQSGVISDPILKDKSLFAKVVARILRSFVNNELLNLPEILTRIRFVTVFTAENKASGKPEFDNALCEEILSEPANIIYPRQKQLNAYVKECLTHEKMSDCVDIIFAISGSENHTRSSAAFTAEDKSGDPEKGDVRFRLKTNSMSRKGYHKCKVDEKGLPGAIALSAWDDRLKTPVHELAHAISSESNGVIVDEYLDEYEYKHNNTTITVGFDFVINKQHRTQPTDSVPQPFARYKLYDYNKDTKKHIPKYQPWILPISDISLINYYSIFFMIAC